jgi:hypothetical protein
MKTSSSFSAMARVTISTLFLFSSLGLFCTIPLIGAQAGNPKTNFSVTASPSTLPSGWAAVSSPNATGNSALASVTCLSTADCWAVGGPIEHWDGGAWSIVPSPNTGNVVSAACASALDCWAVGSYTNSSAAQTLIEHWDGTAWTIVTSTNASATLDNILTGVTCNSASDCWAVGYSNGRFPNPTWQTLIEHWDGTSWTIVFSPNGNNTLSVKISTSQYSYLNSVACASASQCWAVGYYFNNGSTFATLIEQWDGNSWTVVPSAAVTASSANNQVAENDILDSVSCASALDCWAVGASGNADSAQTLIQHWNGAAWLEVPSPNPISMTNPYNFLLGITCPSSTECWAVGVSEQNETGGTSQTLIEQWNGAAWTVATSPPSSGSQNSLNAVACGSTADCWAVGSYYNGSAYQTLTERYTPILMFR